jgi:hypothetical protein
MSTSKQVWVVVLLGMAVGWGTTGCQSTSDAVRVTETVTEAVQKVTEGETVEQLFAYDRRFKDLIERHQKNGVPQAMAVATAVDSMRSLDLGAYPREIRRAYADHREAWRGYHDALSAGTFGDEDGASRKVDRTWQRLTKRAREYGATHSVDPYAYPGETMRTIVSVEVAEGVGDYFSEPDVNVKVYKDNRLVCDRSGENARTVQPNCTLQVGPSSRVAVEVVEEDVQNDDPVASWETTGADLVGQSVFSFGNVENMRVK